MVSPAAGCVAGPALPGPSTCPPVADVVTRGTDLRVYLGVAVVSVADGIIPAPPQSVACDVPVAARDCDSTPEC